MPVHRRRAEPAPSPQAFEPVGAQGNAFRSRFFWRLYSTYAGVVLLTVFVTGALLLGQVQRSLVSELEGDLLQRAARLEPSVRSLLAPPREGAPAPSADPVRSLAELFDVRLTLLDGQGRVLSDSHRPDARGIDESLVEEIAGALEHGSARSRRRSALTGETTLFTARRLSAAPGEPVHVYRLARSLHGVGEQMAALRVRLLLGAALGALAALALALFVARRLTTPISEMTLVAEGLRRGEYGRRVGTSRPDEIGLLGDTLNRLGDEITRRIATISNDDARLRAMLSAMVEGVIAVDHEDRVVFANEAAGRMLGVAQRSAIGRPMWQLLRAPELARLLEEGHTTGRVVRREVVLQRSGREIVLEAHVSRFDGGDAKGLVIVLHDVTELRRLERVRRDFVANVSHELKTPLTSIKGYVETLLDGAIRDERNNVRFLGKIAVHVERLAHLVTDLLSLARIESQEAGLPRQPVDLRRLAAQAVRRHEEALRLGGLEGRFLAGEGDLTVLGDPEAITQVLDNLLDNAIKYTPAPGAVRVSLARRGAEAEIEVSDTGLGIPEDDLERIFERFYRVDKARSREIGGTGLGLSIVKHLVQAMQGSVSVASQLGQGSTFTVALPLVHPEETEVPGGNEPATD